MGKARSRYLTTREAAAHLGLSYRTLETYRVKGGGPPFLAYCNCIRYLRSDLDRWAAARRRRSTSDEGCGDGVSPGKPAAGEAADAAARRGGYLSEKELAALLGVGRSTLARHRARGLGPRFETVDGEVRYSGTAVEAWLASRRGSPDPDEPPTPDTDEPPCSPESE